VTVCTPIGRLHNRGRRFCDSPTARTARMKRRLVEGTFQMCMQLLAVLVRMERLELSWVSPPPPQDGVSANSTTSAKSKNLTGETTLEWTGGFEPPRLSPPPLKMVCLPIPPLPQEISSAECLRNTKFCMRTRRARIPDCSSSHLLLLPASCFLRLYTRSTEAVQVAGSQCQAFPLVIPARHPRSTSADRNICVARNDAYILRCA
jgi:hypothetical protein